MRGAEKQQIRLALLQLEPARDIIELVHTPRDMYELRFVLKRLPYSEDVVRRLATIVLNAVDSGARFRQFECLKILRRIVKDETEPQLSAETTSLLFHLYQHYIFHHRTEVQWCVSSLLRGRPLREEELDWLLSHWKQSEHFVNRLLRYPDYHSKIARWATQVYGHESHKDRRSEVVALAIVEDIPEFAKNDPTEVLLRAIYYSRTPDSLKKHLLVSNFSFEALELYIDISLRLRSKEALRFALEQCDV